MERRFSAFELCRKEDYIHGGGSSGVQNVFMKNGAAFSGTISISPIFSIPFINLQPFPPRPNHRISPQECLYYSRCICGLATEHGSRCMPRKSKSHFLQHTLLLTAAQCQGPPQSRLHRHSQSQLRAWLGRASRRSIPRRGTQAERV